MGTLLNTITWKSFASWVVTILAAIDPSGQWKGIAQDVMLATGPLVAAIEQISSAIVEKAHTQAVTAAKAPTAAADISSLVSHVLGQSAPTAHG